MSYQLTTETVEILKNFARINPQMVFKEGTLQRAVNTDRNFIADVELSSPIPKECAILELNRLLGIIDSCKGDKLPTISFDDMALTVEHEHGEVTIRYAHPDVIVKPVSSQFHMANEIASFDLPAALWTKINRVSSVLQTPMMQVIIKGEQLSLKLMKEKDKGGDNADTAMYHMPNATVVKGTTDNQWMVNFDALALIPGDYHVTVGDIGTSSGSKRVFGLFFTLNHPTVKITYITTGSLVKSRV